MKDRLAFFFWPVLTGVLAALLFLDIRLPGAPPATPVTLSYSQAVRQAIPAVVSIQGFASNKDNESIIKSTGSGVIVRNDGIVLTNFHLLKDANRFMVHLVDGRRFEARVLGADPDTDLAVLQIPEDNLPSIPFANISNIQVGDVVLAIGSPFGLSHSVSMGIVSALGRRVGLTAYEDLIQTDAAINQGNSGGALVDTQGRLVGINTAIYSLTGAYSGVGLTIPINMAEEIANSILKDGRVIRGWLGVGTQELTPSLARAWGIPVHQGMLITDVTNGSPAWEAGLRSGEVILAIDGVNTFNGQIAMRHVALQPPGSKVTIDFLRNGRLKRAIIEVAERPAVTQNPRSAPQP
jgi:serine protease DegS